MARLVCNWALACLLGIGVIAPPQVHGDEAHEVLIRARHLYSADGRWGEPGDVLVRDGKIVAVDVELAAPATARVVEVDSLMPGMVNVVSNAGISGGDAEVSREIAPDFDAYRGLDFDDRAFAEALDEGVTTLQILPGTESVFCGLACIVKTAGEPTSRLLNRSGSLVLAVCSDPTSRNRSRSRPDSIYVRQPTNRMGVVWIVRSTVHRLRQGTPLESLDAGAAAIMQEALAGERPVISVSRTDFDIRSALDLGDEFGFKPVIYGGDEVYRIVDELKQRQAELVYTALGNATVSLRGQEGTELRWNVPGQLAEADIPFCLAGSSLLDQARFAVRFGLEPQQALAAITRRPAEVIGQAERIGTITVGKDADLAALTGDPLRPTSAVIWTMVSGKIHGNYENQ